MSSKEKLKTTSRKRKHADCEQSHLEWNLLDYHTLVQNVEALIPINDTLRYLTRVHRINWDEIAFNDHTSDECKKAWYFLMTKVRKFRILQEITSDIRQYINVEKIIPQNHPHYPPRPLNAYMFLVKEKRKEFSQQHPEWNNIMIGKKCGEIYRELSEKELRKYKKLAADDTKRFNLARDEFYQKHPEFNELPNNKKMIIDDDSRKKEIPRTPIEIYKDCEIENNPNKSSKECRESWFELNDEAKLFWINWAEEEFEKFKVNHKNSDDTKKIQILTKKEREIKDRLSGKPEKPPSSVYNLFTKMMCKKEGMKSISGKDRMSVIAMQWKNTSEDERRQYQTRLEQLWTTYNNALDEYAKKLLPAQRIQVYNAKNCIKKRRSEKKIKLLDTNSEKPLLREPKPPPSTSYGYFCCTYLGNEKPKRVWKRLSASEKEQYGEELDRRRKEFIFNYEIYLKSLSKTELENLAKSKQVIESSEEDDNVT